MSRKTGKWKIWKAGILVLLLAGALLFYRDHLGDILDGVQQVTRVQLGGSLVLAALGYLLEGLAISGMIRTWEAGNRENTVGYGIFTALAGEFYRLATLGNGSGIAKIHFLHQRGIETGNATGLVMIQYLCKRLAIAVLGTVGFGVLCLQGEDAGNLCRKYAVCIVAGNVLALAVVAGFLAVMLSVRVNRHLLAILDWAGRMWPVCGKWVPVWKEQAGILHQSGREVFGQKGRMLCLFLLQMGKCILFYSIPAFLLKGQGSLPAVADILLMAVVYMLAGVIPAPSGIGSLEFVFWLFFSPSVGGQAAISAILVFRFATWFMPFVMGAVLVTARELFPR